MHLNLTDQYRHRTSLIHDLDPRIKVLAALLLILSAGLIQEGAWEAFGLLLLFILSGVWTSRLGFMFVLRRSLVALPFLLIALPIPFTTPGETLFAIPGLGWTLTMDGMLRFGGIMFRAWLAIQSAILLTATTPFPDLLWALGALRVPDSIVATIAFMYRYLFVLGDEALRMLRARASRSPRFNGQPRPSLRWQGRVAGGMVGNLFLRSLARSERVYAAMLARGFDGRMRSRRRFAIRGVDRWVFFSVVVFVVSLLGYTSLR